MAFENRPPGGRGNRHRQIRDGGERGVVFDIRSRHRLDPAEIDELKRRPANDPADDLVMKTPEQLLTIANAKGVFTLAGYRDRAKVLLGTTDEADVLRVLEDRHCFTDESYKDSYLAQGIDSVTIAPRDILALNSSFPQLSTGQRWLAVELLLFLRGNNYIEKCLGDQIPEDLREQVRWQEMVDEHGLEWPAMQSDTYAALSLVSRQNLEREQRREGLVNANNRLTANPLLLRPDVVTCLRTLLQERAIQWTMQLEPRDLDDIVRQIQAAAIRKPSARAQAKKLRVLDEQNAQQIIQTDGIQNLIARYQQTQQELHTQRTDRLARIAEYQAELNSVPRPSRLTRWLTSRSGSTARDEVTAVRTARLRESIANLKLKLERDIEPKIDPLWRPPVS